MEFYRNNHQKIEKLFVVGNGAIERGNEPLDCWLKLLKPHNLTVFDAEALGMERTFSCLVAQESWWRSMLLEVSSGTYLSSASEKIDPILLRTAASVSARIRLGEEYRQSTKLALRKSVQDIMKEEGLFDPNSAVVTINWGRTNLWGASQDCYTIRKR